MIGLSFTVVSRFNEVGSKLSFLFEQIVKPNERVSDRENVEWKSLWEKKRRKRVSGTWSKRRWRMSGSQKQQRKPKESRKRDENRKVEFRIMNRSFPLLRWFLLSNQKILLLSRFYRHSLPPRSSLFISFPRFSPSIEQRIRRGVKRSPKKRGQMGVKGKGKVSLKQKRNCACLTARNVDIGGKDARGCFAVDEEIEMVLRSENIEGWRFVGMEIPLLPQPLRNYETKERDEERCVHRVWWNRVGRRWARNETMEGMDGRDEKNFRECLLLWRPSGAKRATIEASGHDIVIHV